MQVKIVLNVKEMEKVDIREFIRMIRDWELRTPAAEVVGILFETDPEVSSKEAKEIFQGIFGEFEHVVEIPSTKPSFIRLGTRGVTVDGKLVGTCDELTLSLGSASPEDLDNLENATTIGLVKIRNG